MAKLSPFGNEAQFINGIPAAGALLFTYAAGSSTKQTTYTDEAGSTPQANPIVLNARGEPASPIWLTEGLSYKFVLAPSDDTDPPASPIRTIDDVSGVNDSSSSISQWVESGATPTYVNATQFTVPGDKTSDFTVNRRVKCTTTGGTVYGYISVSAYTSLTTVTVVLDSGTLDSGLSSVELGLITPNNTSLFLINNDQLASDAKFGRLINRRIITESETGTAYTAGATKALVKLLGAGGGGGGSSDTDNRHGGGGQAGGYAEKLFTVSAATYDVTIGAAGAAGSTTTAGGKGGDSIFNDGVVSFTCEGGEGGAVGSSGGVIASGNGTVTGTVDVAITGGYGNPSYTGVDLPIGNGANSLLGFGGIASRQNAGSTGAGYGAGGAGGSRVTASRGGSAGRRGVCILEEYA